MFPNAKGRKAVEAEQMKCEAKRVSVLSKYHLSLSFGATENDPKFAVFFPRLK